MPVLTPSHLSNPGISYPFLAILCSAFLLIYLHRRRAHSRRTSHISNSNSIGNTDSQYNQYNQYQEERTEKSPLPHQVQIAKPRIPFPIASSPPTISQPSPIFTHSPSLIATEYPFPPSPETYVSDLAFPLPETENEIEEFGANGIPRRRSYTRPLPDGPGGDVSGEIVVAEGWRRHTRVFGGGVCKACEESERRMSA